MKPLLTAGLVVTVLLGAASAEAQDQAVPAAASADVRIPSLDYTPSANDEKNFDKYYYFHRDGASFEEALADIRYCDGLARGLSIPMGNYDTPYPYNGTVAGAAGGVIANIMVAAIFGSAELRRLRRVNMRRCMHYKGYERYGLPKDLWQEFNFEEGLNGVPEDKRETYLMQQARVASGAKPARGGLGL